MIPPDIVLLYLRLLDSKTPPDILLLHLPLLDSMILPDMFYKPKILFVLYCRYMYRPDKLFWLSLSDSTNPLDRLFEQIILLLDSSVQMSKLLRL